MLDQQLETAKAASLLTLLKLSGGGEQVFQARELTAILSHELRAPLRSALGDFAPEFVQVVERLPADTQIPRSLEDLLCQSRPSLELLGLAKRFAKSCCGPAESALPRELGLVLYYLTIAVARIRRGVRLSELSDEALAGGLQWSSEQKWIEEPLRSLVNEALTQFSRKNNLDGGGK